MTGSEQERPAKGLFVFIAVSQADMNARPLQEEYSEYSAARCRENYGSHPNVVELEAYRCDVTQCQHVGEKLHQTLKELSNIKYALDQAAIIAIADRQGTIHYVNDKFCDISKYSRPELIGQHYRLLNSGYHSQEFFQQLWSTISAGKVWKGEIKDRAKDGSYYWVDTTIVPFVNERGEPVQYLTIQFEITERKLAEEALRASENRYHTLVNLSPVGIFSTNARGEFLDVNARWCEMAGLTAEEAVGEGWARSIHPDDRERILLEWYQAAWKHLPFKSAEYRLQRPDGMTAWVFAQAVAETGAAGSTIGYVGTITDITERKQAEEQLRYHAWHDALTGLPNRAMFLQCLQDALTRGKQSRNSVFAVLFLDLDRFKVVNDSLGHLVGDQLLSGVARRLLGCLRSRDIVARLGGDEFTILLEDIRNERDAIKVAERIQKELAKPFHLAGHEVFTSASIGIVLSGAAKSKNSSSISSHEKPAHLLRDADTAMYHAKERGGIGRYAVFNQAMYTHALALLQLENDLRRAVENCQEFTVHYQPIVCLKTEEISGFEALVRWHHPTRGLVSPAEFISLAEETGLIIPLGRWVLSQAAHQLRVWQEAFPAAAPLSVSVNLSPKQFSHPELVAQIDLILQNTGLDGKSLHLEITESALMDDDSEAVAHTLYQLKNRGIELSIDDFGTGYSSLSRLVGFPLHTLKIDRSFVSQMGEGGENYQIPWTIVTLAHNLGMEVVAEGVERAHQVAQLRSLGCERAQGNIFSKPLDAKAASALLASGKATGCISTAMAPERVGV
ncbi:bifunctional diguanylate cyclase/phosphodiesterase [Kamptonema formosum]|uniref:bifunctional diguanylate cyclase/phosphodiesterase n=1 Tax=Kamptonema formosum TaxID=331992 RepID=UPI00034B9F79|nr:bifunctional diguanylate cyclase/phosphodiesterase [Oscillatoria sp. PCC 10802]